MCNICKGLALCREYAQQIYGIKQVRRTLLSFCTTEVDFEHGNQEFP